MREKTKKEIKQLFLDVVLEHIKNESVILANRPPTDEDVFMKGTLWKEGINIYECKKVTSKWTKIDLCVPNPNLEKTEENQND